LDAGVTPDLPPEDVMGDQSELPIVASPPPNVGLGEEDPLEADIQTSRISPEVSVC
jgi:hypothetical protein